MKGISFKKQPRQTGLAGVGYPHQDIDIKLNKKVVGTIYAPNWSQDGWRISLAFKSDESNAGFAWKFWKPRDDESKARDAAKKLVEKNAENLFSFED